MKCIVLAGGLGDKLWPLSRREYPKQFMNIIEDRSLLQETVGRNLSLCEEFFIMANIRHSFIVEGQMAAFQGLKYRCFYEPKPLGTAFPIVMACMSCSETELIYVINGDHFISGNTYQAEIVEAMDVARKGKFVAFGAEVKKTENNFEYFKVEDENKFKFVFKGDLEKEDYDKNPEKYLVNTGLFMCTAGSFLNEVKKYSYEYYEKCRQLHKKTNTSKRHINIGNIDESIENISLEKILYHSLDNKVIVKPEFSWNEVDSYDVFNNQNIYGYNKNTILNDCRDISVINEDKNKLVVVNNMEAAVVVNTTDALYVTSKSEASKIKNIVEDNGRYESYFNHGRVVYRPWGYRELLKKENSFMVRKVLLLPGKSIDTHKHTTRSEHWSVVEGKLEAVIDGVSQTIDKNMSAFVPVGIEHSLHNDTDENVIIIEVSTGHNIIEKDMITTKKDEISNKRLSRQKLIKLEPAFKDYLWGGSKLRDVYGKKCDYDKIAESWELSAHKDGNSIVASGKYMGRTFSDYLRISGKEILGWKAENFTDFPILIKFIDAREDLSIQVHPNDEYALKNENELGKNEMWYIIDCDESASLYCGLSKPVSKDEIKSRIENNTIIEVLNKVEVKRGDVIFVEAGEIHAIGGGIMLCEIQQNSNCTYRLYDYDRKDRFGNPRELHLDKALSVANLSAHVMTQMQTCENETYDEAHDNKEYDNEAHENEVYENEAHSGYSTQILVSCKYFECIKYDIETKADVLVDDASFRSFIVVEGAGVISDGETSFEFSKGDSYFIPAGIKKVEIIGKSVILVTHI